jgi:hypothetical protein
MTRCPDCGSEYAGGQCTDCGLTPVAAEFLRRRRLFRRTAWFLVGAIAFVPVSQLYPPLELDGILIFGGLIFFFALTLAVLVDRGARSGRDVEILKRIYYGFIPVPWLLAALLFINGRFDSPTPTPHDATVVGKFSMPGFLHHQRLIVISWREARHFERLAVTRVDFDRFKKGDTVTVQVRNGAVGIPWVYAVYRR